VTDTVGHEKTHYAEDPKHARERACLEAINAVLKEYGCQIVISKQEQGFYTTADGTTFMGTPFVWGVRTVSGEMSQDEDA
jgi:hypothetical protein